MKLIAIEAIRLSAEHEVRPGEAFELDDAKGVAELLAIGAAREDDGASDTTEELADSAPAVVDAGAEEEPTEPEPALEPAPEPAIAARKAGRK